MVATQEHTPTTSPLQRMLQAFPLAHQKPNGYWAHDDNPKFDFLVSADQGKEGNIRIFPWTGRTPQNILAMGKIPLRMADLYAHPGTRSPVESRDKLSLLDLAQYLKIHHGVLLREGFIDEYAYTYSNGNTIRCVKMGGYFTPDGKPHSKNRVRVALHGKTRFLFDQNTPGAVIPCGLHYLGRARAAGYLFIGEGESDWITMTVHGVPFIGLPGSEMVGCLDVSLLADIPIVYILEEPDQAAKLGSKGRGFYKSVRQHLRSNGYQGTIYSVRFMELLGFKDPSDLHKAIFQECSEKEEGPFHDAVHARFVAEIEAAREQALPEGNEHAPTLWGACYPAALDFEMWYMQLLRCPREILPWSHLCILSLLFPIIRDTKPEEELGWHLDSDALALQAGLIGEAGKRIFLRILGELEKKLGLIVKEHRGRKKDTHYEGTDLYIRPRLVFYTPRGYVALIQDQRKQGGDMPRCKHCKSNNVDRYDVLWCRDCQQWSHTIVYEAPLAPCNPDPEPGPVTVEATATIAPLEDEALHQEPFPELHDSCISDKEESITDTRFVYLGAPADTLFSSLAESTQPESEKAPYSGPYPPPRPYPLCHYEEQAAWQWNPRKNDGNGGYECAMCHPPGVAVQTIPKPKPKASWLIKLPIAAVMP